VSATLAAITYDVQFLASKISQDITKEADRLCVLADVPLSSALRILLGLAQDDPTASKLIQARLLWVEGGNPKEIVSLLRSLHDGGCAPATYLMAQAIEIGMAPEMRLDPAALFLESANQNYLPAMEYAADSLIAGNWGIERRKEAIMLLRKAAEMGSGASALTLSHALRAGDCLPEDEYEADVWLLRASQAGHPVAMEEVRFRRKL